MRLENAFVPTLNQFKRPQNLRGLGALQLQPRSADEAPHVFHIVIFIS